MIQLLPLSSYLVHHTWGCYARGLLSCISLPGAKDLHGWGQFSVTARLGLVHCLFLDNHPLSFLVISAVYRHTSYPKSNLLQLL